MVSYSNNTFKLNRCFFSIEPYPVIFCHAALKRIHFFGK